MSAPADVLCAGIIVADHVSSPIPHLPEAGELVLADQLLLTIGGCAANVAVDLAKLGASAAVVGRVGGDVFGRVVCDMLRERGVDVSAVRTTPGVDVFVPNNYEAELITGEYDPMAQAERFHALGAKTAIVTLGDRGAVLVADGVRLRAGSFATPFVDGSGGGDAFAAGYIDGLLRGLDAEGCLRRASAVGASCVRAIGTTTSVFTREECDAFLRENTLRIERV